jgi:hypothetical protein
MLGSPAVVIVPDQERLHIVEITEDGFPSGEVSNGEDR